MTPPSVIPTWFLRSTLCVPGSTVPDLSEFLAAYRGTGYLVAPAGFGKTHLIAEAGSTSANRQLVLTHTYAGVNVLRRKMRDLRVSAKSFRVDTIASWALRLSL